MTSSLRSATGRRRRAPAAGIAIVFMTLSLVAAACGSHGSRGPAPGGAVAARHGADDKLARVLARGTLLLPTDTAYPPASFAVKREGRRPGTDCAENQL